MVRVVGLVGAGGFGREVMPLLRRAQQGPDTRVVLVADQPPAEEVNGAECLTPGEFFALPCDARLFNVAVGAPPSRRRIAADFLHRGAIPLDVLAPTVRALDEVATGEGLIMCDFSMITSNVVLGRFVHLNLYAYVAHDCVVGDFVTLGPGAKVNGNVHIGDGANIGAGANIINGTPDRPVIIGAGATVGLGAVVLGDVAPGSTVVGVPARPVERRSPSRA